MATSCAYSVVNAAGVLPSRAMIACETRANGAFYSTVCYLTQTLMLFYPIWDETNGSAQSYWLPKLHNIVAAYQDHCLS